MRKNCDQSAGFVDVNVYQQKKNRERKICEVIFLTVELENYENKYLHVNIYIKYVSCLLAAKTCFIVDGNKHIVKFNVNFVVISSMRYTKTRTKFHLLNLNFSVVAARIYLLPVCILVCSCQKCAIIL